MIYFRLRTSLSGSEVLLSFEFMNMVLIFILPKLDYYILICRFALYDAKNNELTKTL